MASTAHRLLVLLALVIPAGVVAPAHAETYCKWVDENGVTHYAPECPRSIDGSIVDVDALVGWPDDDETPTDDADDNDAPRPARTQAELEAAALRAAQSRADDACRDALRRLDELSTALPVYRDDEGGVHADETLHHWWYRGARTYVEGPERRALFAETQAEAGRLCGPRIDAERPRVPVFTRAPLPRDVILWLEDSAASPVSLAELCPYATGRRTPRTTCAGWRKGCSRDARGAEAFSCAPRVLPTAQYPYNPPAQRPPWP